MTPSGDPRVTPNTGTFQYRPDGQVVGVLRADAVDGATDALVRAGIDLRAIEVLLGQEGRSILDASGTEHGTRAALVRLLQGAGSAGIELALYDGALQNGHAVVFVPVRDRGAARAVGALVRHHGGDHLQYFDGPLSESV